MTYFILNMKYVIYIYLDRTLEIAFHQDVGGGLWRTTLWFLCHSHRRQTTRYFVRYGQDQPIGVLGGSILIIDTLNVPLRIRPEYSSADRRRHIFGNVPELVVFIRRQLRQTEDIDRHRLILWIEDDLRTRFGLTAHTTGHRRPFGAGGEITFETIDSFSSTIEL